MSIVMSITEMEKQIEVQQMRLNAFEKIIKDSRASAKNCKEQIALLQDTIKNTKQVYPCIKRHFSDFLKNETVVLFVKQNTGILLFDSFVNDSTRIGKMETFDEFLFTEDLPEYTVRTTK